MAAYAAVLSLLNAVERIQTDISHYENLFGREVSFLKGMGDWLKTFLETYSHGNSEEQRDLERRIADVANEAEHAIENCVGDIIIYGVSTPTHLELLATVEEKLISLSNKVREGYRLRRVEDRQLSLRYYSSTSAPAVGWNRADHGWSRRGQSTGTPKKRATLPKLPASSSSPPAIGQKSAMVGFEKEQLQIMERITQGQSSRLVIPIVGMAGIGKTTLARSIFDKPLIAHHFDMRIWITISQKWTLRNLLLQIPICQKEKKNIKGLVTANHLGEVLYRSLCGRRYLIILDDLWSLDSWDKIKLFIPNNKDTSRIIVTTRLSNVATHFGSCGIQMDFLDLDKSWKLFCGTAFGLEGCPSKLLSVGERIVKKCNGLPLSIVVVAGLLSKSCKIEGFWEIVAKDVTSFLNLDDDENCQKVLSLSYNHLSPHLKPCFLYMGIFPEDYEIHISQLVKLWVAEGFLEPNDNHKSCEESAENYLKDLADRNLILVRKRGLNGKIKTCYIHDLLRDLCLRMAKKEGFICVVKNRYIPKGLHNEHRIVFHGNHHTHVFHAIEYPLRAHTLICGSWGLPQLEKRSLRILDASDIDNFEEICQYVNLRYIRIRWTPLHRIPSSISRLWNVQTIICSNKSLVFAPVEIWNMKHLRHVEFNEICLPDPPTNHSDSEHNHTLGCLQTFRKIVNFQCTSILLERIPHIKKLQIKYEEFQEESKTGIDYHLENLCHFSMLESLKVSFHVKQSTRMDLQGYLTYPSSLKKLTLDNIELFWDDLTKIGSLPNLEDLKLGGSIAGSTWNLIEEEFCSLKSLRIVAYTDLISWNVEYSGFLVLENLELAHVPQLDEIPLCIFECIPNLKAIHLGSCRASTAISLMEILVEQENNFGNEGLQIRVTFMNDTEEASFREMAESKGLKSDNFMVEIGK